MLISSIDSDNNLFQVTELVPPVLVEQIVNTPWLDLKWIRQEGQESWPRRRILDTEIPWIAEWNQYLQSQWSAISTAVGTPLQDSPATIFWLDEPGFVCPIHTDGEMEGSLHVSWIGKPNLGTCFYHYKNPKTVRHEFKLESNNGYIMLNNSDEIGYRKLQWHGMLNPVPVNTYRLTSYTWVYSSK
jgi:hypothetical protein